ncbi:MalM family protein [Marinobacter koreensis]|uniref:MalM family protein n=1 Tax=Marinobacter koreensis TaxID=335974 RepID=A0ABW0RH84_9GAMM|nr:MalM family protein [Marinobacter koreensis]MCK7547289.1 MalM family protein [Marinobacter koreensis]
MSQWRLDQRLCLLTLVTLLSAGCQIGGSPVSEKEGYFTWVDEQGQVRYSPIPKGEGDKTRKVTTSAGKGNASADAGDGSPEVPTGLQEEDEYTLENYPDANELAKKGYIRKGEPKPYFTWKDAEGNIRVSYYTPDTRTDQQKGRIPPPITLTPATTHEPGEGGLPEQPVEGYDPNALAILGADEAGTFFNTFARACCQSLKTGDRQPWISGREFEVDLDAESSTHGFSTGDSPYAVIELPWPRQHPDFVLHLRSYANEGVFVPSLVFLNADFQPLRVVTDIAATFVPENWHSLAHLEAWLPVFPAKGERWMVIFTRNRDLDNQTVTETRYGPKAIPHLKTGEIGLEMASED